LRDAIQIDARRFCRALTLRFDGCDSGGHNCSVTQ
jgi:hypothetical protein